MNLAQKALDALKSSTKPSVEPDGRAAAERAYLDEHGREMPSDRPVSMPIGFHRPPSLAEQIHTLVRRELSMQAHQSGMETFEEADDFDVGDDFDPTSPYEMHFDQEAAARPSAFKQEAPATTPPAEPAKATPEPPIASDEPSKTA